ncbi:unannotated protein [freshwater metagenome]|uniref:Unannotated protein n=1 Tax=freshwater metagenome TaxID=449393 RepID=A0A6J7DN73_9ZZZZ
MKLIVWQNRSENAQARGVLNLGLSTDGRDGSCCNDRAWIQETLQRRVNILDRSNVVRGDEPDDEVGALTV